MDVYKKESSDNNNNGVYDIEELSITNKQDAINLFSTNEAAFINNYGISLMSVNYTKNDLIRDLNNAYQAELKQREETFVKDLLRPNSAKETVTQILDCKKMIENASAKYKVKKEIIQSILFREIIFLNVADPVADTAVQNYFINRANIERFNSLPWYKQVLAGSPQILVPEREDSSTGLGQVTAKTAISALANPNINYNNWKDRKRIWYSLRDNDEYNINMVALILYRNGGNKNLLNPSRKQIIDAAAIYNTGSVDKGQAYGKKIYTYYGFFSKYN